ncbi:MAG: translational GTPase TypA [Acidimicrobiaceae bacterium]|nr:translational GTPase TypA [Acidimicrobiaceae bacterium]
MVPRRKVPVREDLRNIAIIAHVDHGKTTLVDAMLRQSGAFRDNQEVLERILDSGDLEREKGITILAKNISINWHGMRVNIVDTPGHADFGGEVERGLLMVDGAVLLVDAAEGPLPQTRFVLRKALDLKLPIITVLNKIDRPDARPKEVLDEIFELFFDLGADEHQIEFPTLYASGRSGWASLSPDEHGDDLSVLFDAIRDDVPAPTFEADGKLGAMVSNIDGSPYLGRLAICRIDSGRLKKGQQVAWFSRENGMKKVRISELFVPDNLDRKPVDEVGPGEIAIIAGLEDASIGDSISDPDNPVQLPPITVDEPAISMTFSVNSTLMSGREGSKVTARLIGSRLTQELIGNVSLKVLNTDRTDTWEVQGRGELALAVLIETMRREGFELTIGKPQAITRVIDGKLCEPYERLEVDIPEEYFGSLTQCVSPRKATLVSMTSNGSGWTRAIFHIPSRGLLGLRSDVLSQTKGTAIIHHAFDGYAAYAGDIKARASGSLVADRTGATTAYALINLQDRGQLFVGPGEEVYEGMVIGENSRTEDMDVNPTKEKKLTNMRSSTSEELVRLSPPKRLSLEAALEFIAEDECLEVTPLSVRIRKTALQQTDRARSRSSKRVSEQD